MPTILRLTTCYDGKCPAVDLYLESGSFRVTGTKVPAEDKQGLPDAEDQVDVPAEVMLSMVTKLLQIAVQAA